MARTAEEVEQIQRLRYDVFTEDMGAVFPQAQDGVEQDRFDQWCEHLMVRELDTGRVVGTYRILTPEKAREAGGYYSESEFDLSGLGALREQLVEVGRSCTHADYRNGAVIMLLWSGLAEYLRRGGYEYVLGCASVSLRDDGVTAAEVWRNVARHLDDPALPRVRPLHRYPIERLNSTLPARVPPLIKGYLKLGAKVCGEPAWDPDFNAADFPVLLSMAGMDERYRRHFGLDREARR
ncbi:GNAT family N-acetyltransferase [Bordetella pertussis]